MSPTVPAARLRCWADPWHRPVFVMFLAAFVAAGTACAGPVPAAAASWAGNGFIWLTAATTLIGLARHLPLQNVLTVSALILGGSAVVMGTSTLTGIPFGARTFTDELGWKIFGILPGSVPALWLAVIVNGRGVARLVLRPWRATPAYGFWVIGLTGLLVMLFDLGLEPFAATEAGWWLWPKPTTGPAWYGVPGLNYFGWGIMTVGLLTLSTPWLINKHPVAQPVDSHPLVVWGLLNLLLATSNALHQHWPAVAITLAANTVVVVSAARGLRR